MEIDFANDPSTTDAMARLEAAEASEPAPKTEAFVQTDSDAPPVESKPDSIPEKPNKSSTDTPAEVKPNTDTKPKEEAAKPDARKSDFAKANERKDTSWKNLNAEKEAFAKERDALQQQKQQLEQQQQEFQQRQAKAQNRFTPEQYEQAAKNRLTEADSMLLRADGMDKRANDLEEAGKAGEAELMRRESKQLREDAAGEKGLAKQYNKLAQNARNNPDPTAQQIQQQNNQKIQAYTLEAAKQWPDIAVKDSPLQKATAILLNEARGNGLNEQENPAIRYHAIRLAAAELASARVPDMEKQLGALQAKVKELEALTAPGGGQGSVQVAQGGKSFDEMSDAEQEASLRSQAAGL